MGKTRPTYRDQLRALRTDEWSYYRKWLRKRHQTTFDDMWAHAVEFADAAGEANPRNPLHGALMSICLGQQEEINQLRERIEALEADAQSE